MKLINFLNKLIKNDGFVLIDADKNQYTIGKPEKKDPIKLKILDKNLHHKLLLHPDLYFGEAYTNGSVLIENGSLTELLDIILKNVGRGEINFYSSVLNQIKGFYRSLTHFNLIKKSKQNVAHHYDISEKLYDLFLDKQSDIYQEIFS